MLLRRTGLSARIQAREIQRYPQLVQQTHSIAFNQTKYICKHMYSLFFVLLPHVSALTDHLQVGHLQRNACILLQMASLKMVHTG
jgi:hypothetical protein